MKFRGKDFNVVTRAKGFDAPLKWKDAQRIFVNPWSDFFIEEADEWRPEAYRVMQLTPQHTYLVLTKRIERTLSHWPTYSDQFFKHLCLGVSIENQRQADERIPKLLQIPAAKRFVSIEPLLGEINLHAIPVNRDIKTRLGDFTPINYPRFIDYLRGRQVTNLGIEYSGQQKLDWVIVGGESGGPEYRRLVDPYYESVPLCAPYSVTRKTPIKWNPKPKALQWVRSLRDQCQAADVAFFFKQWGGPKHDSGGSLLDGQEWKQIPQQ